MFRSLRARLWLSYLLFSGLILGVVAISLLVYVLRNPFNIRQTEARLQALIADEARLVSVLRSPPQSLEQSLERFGQNQNLRVVILERDGTPTIDPMGDEYGPLPDRITIPEEIRTRPERGTKGPPPTGRYRDENNEVWLYAVRPIMGQRYLMVAAPQPPFPWATILRDDLLPPLLQGGIVAITASIFLALLVAGSVSSPLQKVTGSIRKAGQGNYTPISVKGPNEVQELAHSFNEMYQRVQASQQSQRDFVANVSHELKTPLTSIEGYAQAIREGVAETPEMVAESARIIHEEAGRMHRLVEDLLSLAKLDAGTVPFFFEPLDLAAVLHAVIARLVPASQAAQVSLETDIVTLPQMVGDGDRLAQVFTNLVDNAIKHSPKGETVHIHAAQEEEMLVVRIKDAGSGIPADERDRIFERFYQLDKSRAKNNQPGVGLGLPIAHEIVESHHGSIRVESVEGQGSVFVVKIPVVQPKATQ
jgi:signal transduction histidine kinase